MEQNNELRVVEFFGGISAARKALIRQKIPHKIVDYVEIDESAVKSYNAMYDENFKPQDITKWNKDLDNIDLMVHGSPCQSISTAGKQEGANEGSGTRSSLMYESLRVIDKVRPKCVVWENVANLASKKHKHNLDKYLAVMSELGYTSSYKILNAKDYGIPQDRNRIFVVSIFGDKRFEFPPKEELKKSYKDFLEPNYDVDKYVLGENHIRRVKGTETYDKEYSFGGKVVEGDIFPTITRCYGRASGNCGSIRCKEGYRALTIRERWRLMGFDDEDFDKASQVNSDTQLKYQAGNSIVVNVLEAIFNSLFKENTYKYRQYKQNEIIDNTVRALLQIKNIDNTGTAKVEFWTPNCSFFLTVDNTGGAVTNVKNKE